MKAFCRYIVVFPLCALLTGCFLFPKNEPKERYRQTKLLMDTVFQIDVCAPANKAEDVEKAYRQVWARCEEIAQQLNVFDEKSEVARVNQSAGRLISVSPELYQIISNAKAYAKMTRGAFDITIRPLMELWKKAQEEQVFPSPEALIKAKEAVGISKVLLIPPSRVKFSHPKTKIDLGGIAKGYTLDEAARIFREQGLFQFFIDAGGDVYVGGMNCRQQPWRVGIRHPKKKDDIVGVVELTNAAVTTSGDYERYFEIQNERWSHIINPLTGYPSQMITSATVIAPSAIMADALATALSVLPPDEGARLIDSLGEGFSSLTLTLGEGQDGRTYQSRTFVFR